MRALSLRQSSILSFISGYISEFGYSPTFREVGRFIGISSLSLVFFHLNRLEQMGYITRKKFQPRSINIPIISPSLIIRSIPFTKEIRISLNISNPERIGIFPEFS